MSSSHIILITICIFIPQILGSDPLFHFCSSSENFTENSSYQNNLHKVNLTLFTKTPPSGFGSASSGRVYGIALCRGDVSRRDCQTCVAESATEIRKRCPYNKAAIIWYDYCLFKYADEAFFGRIDNGNKFYMWNIRVVSEPVSFNEKTKELLTGLTQKAYVNPRLFETGEMQLDGSTKLYGLVQCSRDLSSDVCKICLDDIIREIPACCDGKEGGRVVSGSCNFRYEIYPFVNSY
ncbi:antimicrobial ginkbilobin-2-like protein [Euphorbia lathyris]|uniref:antimicrobial ginkbilobin-2-like protein n=1 Tax=Euphorbia lathyris TaxID=212925 RepID=UPI003313DD4B